MEHQSLSTSALAKALSISTQQLFGSLSDYGWIKRHQDSWELTNKGEFEGGEYVHSKKYGRYIVWPNTITDHALLQAMENNRTISAKSLGEQYNLSAREVNRILAELGWIKHSPQGWELTAIGTEQGGVQFENEQSGTFYVIWPEYIHKNDRLNAQLCFCSNINSMDVKSTSLLSLDGHVHTSKAHLKICHWLYMAGFTHACNRLLPGDEA